MTTTQSVYESKPWLARYRDDYNHGEVTVEFASALDMVRAAVERDPDCEIVRYFDGTMTMRELDELSDAFAVALTERGFAAGDRLGTYLQNIPQALVVVVGTWKAGGIVVSINPMSRQRELTTILFELSGAPVPEYVQPPYGGHPAVIDRGRRTALVLFAYLVVPGLFVVFGAARQRRGREVRS